MSRMDREVNLEAFQNTIDTSHRYREWFAQVVGRGNKVIHTTDFHPSENEALMAAEKWTRENGHVSMAF